LISWTIGYASWNVVLGAIEAKLDLLVAKVPSWWQPPLGVVAVLGAIGALVALLKLLKVIV
jgi:hypothetical protein